MSKKKKILLIIGGIVIIAVAVLITISVLTEDKVTVHTKKVEKKTVVQTVQASGKVEPVLKVVISAYVSGQIVELPVNEGQMVSAGDLLVVLDSTRYRASHDQTSAARAAAESQAQLAQANYEQGERTLNRTIQLHKQSLVSDEELENVKTKLEVLRAQAKAAKDQVAQTSAYLRLVGDDLSKTVLRSPIDGTIITLNKEAGEIVMGSGFTRDSIMTVADMSAMQIVVEVDENDVRDIQLGQAASITIDAFPKDKFTGTVTEIANSAKVTGQGTQEETTTFDVTVMLTGDISQVRSGMSATAYITTAEHADVLALSIQCLTMRDPEADPKKPVALVRADKLKDVIFKVEDERAKLLPVTTGISSEFDIEVEGEGLAEGLEIVCGPYKTLNKDLKDHDLLNITDETAPTAGEKEK